MFPCEEIYPSVVDALLCKGRTIDEIEASERKGKVQQGDRSQYKLRDKRVWHSKRSVEEHVAKRLKLHPTIWGPDRRSNDFQDAVSAAIDRLREDDKIADWAGGRRLNIYRLADGHGLERPSRGMSAAERPAGAPETRWRSGPYTDEDHMQMFMRILDQGAKDGTYKFALARALVELCGERDAGSARPREISYKELAERFLRYYWRQECVFHIRQSFQAKPESLVVRGMRGKWGDRGIRDDFDRLDARDKEEVCEQILCNAFGSARSRKGIVVPRFQKIKVGPCVEEIQMFYEWDDSEKRITVRDDAFKFLQSHRLILQSAVTHKWARYLERTNGGLPNLIAKVECVGGLPARNSARMREARRALYRDGAECFYCRCTLDRRAMRLDHVIPWSFIFDDPLWNLVPSCTACSGRKGNALPDCDAYERLVRRNEEYAKGPEAACAKKFAESLDSLGPGGEWKRTMRCLYQACKDHEFTVMEVAEIQEGRDGGPCGEARA